MSHAAVTLSDFLTFAWGAFTLHLSQGAKFTIIFIVKFYKANLLSSKGDLLDKITLQLMFETGLFIFYRGKPF